MNKYRISIFSLFPFLSFSMLHIYQYAFPSGRYRNSRTKENGWFITSFKPLMRKLVLILIKLLIYTVSLSRLDENLNYRDV